MILHLKDINFTCKITRSVFISPLRSQDDKMLYQHVCQESSHLLPWCPWMESLNNLSDIQSFLSHYKQQLLQNEYFRLGIYHHNHLIGWVSAFNFNWQKKSYELGYWIIPAHQRKGYILYTAKFMMSLLSSLFHLKKIYIQCKKENYPSRCFAHRLQAKHIKSLNNSMLYLYKIVL